jgi:scyllo-inositol 2-dehydrogenase (NADP+)
MEQTIGVGITSYGMSGRIFHAPLLAHDRRFRMKRILQRAGNDATESYLGLVETRFFEELLDDQDISLVIINTPDNTHYALAKRSLEAGKHTVVEKPFTQTVQQGEDLIALARERRVMLSVFQNRRWDGDFLTLRKIAAEGTLGRIVEFEARWDRYRNYIQVETWKEESSTGAGLLCNLGSHLIDQALVLFGFPEAVTAHLGSLRTDSTVDDWFDVRLHSRSVKVAVRASYLVREQGPRYALHGTLGSFVKYGIDPQEEALKRGGDPSAPDWGHEPEEWWGVLHTDANDRASRRKVETLPGNYLGFYDNVYRHLTRGEELAVKPEEALWVIRVIEAAKKSSAEGRSISLKTPLPSSQAVRCR